MKKITLIFSLYFSVFFYGQQEPEYTMFWNNYSLFNPANTGFLHDHYVNANYRTGSQSYNYNLNSFSFLYENNINQIKSGIALAFVKDNNPYIDKNAYTFNYAYHPEIFYGTLSLGVGLTAKSIKFNDSNLYNSTVNPNITETKINVSLGALYRLENLEFGLSVTQMNRAFYNNVNYQAQQQVFGLITYKFEFDNGVDLKPSIYYKSDYKNHAIDFNILLIYNDFFWCGATYRNTNTIAGIIGLDINKRFRVGYSLDYYSYPIYHGFSHEFTLGYIFNK
jgi:type IX secretion system PorP/SprF family membrane protein